MGANIVAIVIIFGDRAIIFFCDHQDTGSESQELEMRISQPILTHRKIPKALWDNNIHTLQYRRIILWKFSMFWRFNNFPTICDHPETECE